MKKTRVRNSKRYLDGYLKDDEQFYVGILYEDYCKCDKLEEYNLPTKFIEGNVIVPKPNGSVTRANTNGKYVRHIPEEKTTKRVHIHYFHKRWRKIMDFDRDYNTYIKDLLHKFDISFTFMTNDKGQKVVVSPVLNFLDSEGMKNTHTINMFCEIFNDFEIFTENKEPAIHFNKRFDMELLPSGHFTGDTFKQVEEIGYHYTRNETEKKAFKERLLLLQEYNPDVIGKGPSGFDGYIAFEFKEFNIVILETMFSGNATYVFDNKDYESKVFSNKQTILRDKLMKKRFLHKENWRDNITMYLESLKSKS